MEHHSNIVPWQLLCEEKGAKLKVVPINDEGEFLFDEYEKLLSDRTKIVAVNHVSNALGSINPIRDIIKLAHERGALALIDGAQAVAHVKVDVQALDCDFYAFSSHKIFGPTGIGILYGKRALLEAMPPWEGGGDMIKSVTFEKNGLQRPALQVRSGHAEYRRCHRFGRRSSLCQRRGSRIHRRLRSRLAGLRDRAHRGGQRCEADRHSQEQGERAVV